jgi:hypothetical protein
MTNGSPEPPGSVRWTNARSLRKRCRGSFRRRARVIGDGREHAPLCHSDAPPRKGSYQGRALLAARRRIRRRARRKFYDVHEATGSPIAAEAGRWPYRPRQEPGRACDQADRARAQEPSVRRVGRRWRPLGHRLLSHRHGKAQQRRAIRLPQGRPSSA